MLACLLFIALKVDKKEDNANVKTYLHVFTKFIKKK